jgi:type I restriction enzyme S subunit
MAEFEIALPTVAEQRRIVAKVDQLMTLVDQLEAQLELSRGKAAQLMEAVMAELTAAESMRPVAAISSQHSAFVSGANR